MSKQTWRIAESLETLRHQLNEAFPKRSKASDGGIGDAKHKSRSSDHNPHLTHKGLGIVTARDFTHDPKTGIDCQWLADTLVKNRDPRIKYIIWNRQICSSLNAPWKWRPYNGVNAHTKHLHLSVNADPKHFDSTKPWKLDFPKSTKSDVAKISAAASTSDGSSTVEKGQIGTQNAPLDSNQQQQPPTINQAAENIINTGDPAPPPPEDKVIEAPSKDGATATATRQTILGLAVPPTLYLVYQSVLDMIEKGFIDAREIGSGLFQLLLANWKWVFLLIALLIVIQIVKKIARQVTFWLTIVSQMVPHFNNIHVTGDKSVEEPKRPWYKFW